MIRELRNCKRRSVQSNVGHPLSSEGSTSNSNQTVMKKENKEKVKARQNSP